MYTMPWEEVCYEILDYKSKLLQIKLPLFHIARGLLHEFNFLEIYTYVNKATLLIHVLKKYT